MKIAVLLVLLSVSECSSRRREVGYVGQNVTLPCTYNAKLRQIPFCWGRGEIPSWGCDQQLISSDGYRVKEGSRVSSRYQLLGRLDKGDVSLTILNLTEADAGEYGCRVEIPGWFNDEKHHFTLVVLGAAHSTTSVSTTTASKTVTQTVSVSTRAVQLTSTNSSLASSSSSSGPLEAEENSSLTAVLVGVLFGFTVLLTAVGLLIIIRKWGPLSKICQSQQVNTLVQFGLVSSTLQLPSHTAAVENIYEIDVEDNRGEYEELP